jgi:hypothetical protein
MAGPMFDPRLRYGGGYGPALSNGPPRGYGPALSSAPMRTPSPLTGFTPVDYDPFADDAAAAYDASADANNTGAPSRNGWWNALNAQNPLMPMGAPDQIMAPPAANPPQPTQRSVLAVDRDPIADRLNNYAAQDPQLRGLAVNADGSWLAPLGRPDQVVSLKDFMRSLSVGEPAPYQTTPVPPAWTPDFAQFPYNPDDTALRLANANRMVRHAVIDPPLNVLRQLYEDPLYVPRLVAPNLTKYLTEEPPLPSIVPNAAGKLQPTDNPYAVPALLDVLTLAGPGAAEGAGLIPRSLEALAPTVTRATRVGALGGRIGYGAGTLEPSALAAARLLPRSAVIGEAAAGGGAGVGEAAAPTVAPAAAAPVTLTGQLHHAISKKPFRALEKHPILKGIYSYRDPSWVTRAKDLAAHNGYDTPHRKLDAEVANWINDHQEATQADFEAYLRELYQRSDLRARFPNGLP